jgi:hypothetical protein
MTKPSRSGKWVFGQRSETGVYRTRSGSGKHSAVTFDITSRVIQKCHRYLISVVYSKLSSGNIINRKSLTIFIARTPSELPRWYNRVCTKKHRQHADTNGSQTVYIRAPNSKKSLSPFDTHFTFSTMQRYSSLQLINNAFFFLISTKKCCML